ncbi:acyl-CoA N-acyltransferase [Naematelia encephala]|uniref:Acyl-CoA N-acyltransferase n=1 Tax=Naematelia encephala TaxID=71784 RepID=A0A1Y2AYY4_9TREE|nr:acyl-CoA N-acyltransferase [Naematelia encephala]
MATSKSPDYTIKIAESKDEIEACYDVRIEVFAVEQGFPLETEIDEYDPISVHFLLCVSQPSPPPESTSSISPFSNSTSHSSTSKAIGTIRWTPSIGKVARLAILSPYRKYGLGRKLVEALHAHAANGGQEMEKIIKYVDGKRVAQLKLHSQMQVVPWYEKFGYRAEGDTFDEEGAPHQKMTCEIEIRS